MSTNALPLSLCFGCHMPMSDCALIAESDTDPRRACCTDCDHLPGNSADAVRDLLARREDDKRDRQRLAAVLEGVMTGWARVYPLDSEQALQIIAARACEHDTHGPGACIRSGRSPLARFGAQRACDPCIAWAALLPDRGES